jgi:xylose isomerase
MRSIHRALDRLDVAALRQAQDRQDALAASRIARQALLSCAHPAGL